MPAMQTVQIINKSGKIVSTSKHLVNIFKDAKDAYQDKKAEIKAELRAQAEERHVRKAVLEARLERVRIEQRPLDEPRERRHTRTESEAEGSSRGERRDRERRRPPLTTDNLSRVSGSVAGSRHGSRRGSRSGDEPQRPGSSRHGSRQGGSRHGDHAPRLPRSPSNYQQPHFDDVATIARSEITRPDMPRRHTELDPEPTATQTRHSQAERVLNLPVRSLSSPNMSEEIDLNLAYGDMHGVQLSNEQEIAVRREAELGGLMSKLDMLMLEAQCVQHSATTIMTSLQSNPEAMAAVALTLAEISTLVAKMSPSILTALKASAPAVVALLASPQFLIAGGLAVGVTIVMFGGYKIIKKIQNAAREKEEPMMEEALTYEGELSSVESWRRGITQGLDEDGMERSVETSVEGEYITPTADRLRRDKIRVRAREEGRSTRNAPSSIVSSEVTESTIRGVRRRGTRHRSDSESIRDDQTETSMQTESTVKPRKEKKERKSKLEGKKDKKEKEKEKEKDSKWTRENAIKKPNALTVFIKRQVDAVKADRVDKSAKSTKGERSTSPYVAESVA